MAEVFERLDNAEIFAAGKWNNMAFSEDDLDSIVRSFDALNLGGRVPLKLGHEGPDARKNPETQYAMGWVRRVWKEGKKIMADLDVPAEVYKRIKEGYLKFVSVELLKDVRASTRTIPWVLDAVALLGSDQPAVGTLKDLQALTMHRDFEFDARVSFARADYTPFNQPIGDRKHMSDEKDNASAIAALQDKMLQLNSRLDESINENRELKRTNQELKQVQLRFERLQEDVNSGKVEAHRKELVNRLERAVKDEDITPSARERFSKSYELNDNDRVMRVDLGDVEDFIKENPNPFKKTKKVKTFTRLDSPDGDVPDGVSVDAEALMRTNALLAKQGKHQPTADDLIAATKAVFAANPDLAQRYKSNADSQYGT